MNKSFLVILGFLFLTSCTKPKPQNPYQDFIELDTKVLHLVFSHNINGETHPCGCRHFPLGGLPQVAGKLNDLKATGEVILVDTGDMLFPSPNLPPTMKDSFTFGARNLSKGMDQLGLKYLVPGDQDMALGFEFLSELLKNSKYKLLISNLKDPKTIAHKKLVVIAKGEDKIFLIGFADPSVLPPKVQNYFLDTTSAMKQIIPELKKAGYDEKNKAHRLILLSHSGMANDQALVKKFANIDWVLGAHTQNFTKLPYEEGKTKLAQVLSRNHYLGELQVTFQTPSDKDSWILHEIRDELKDKLSPNPFSAFIEEHKEKMKQLQIQEQSALATYASGETPKINTASSCIECHQPQVDFWSGTPHSIAYATLINTNEDKNLNCIGCHSVGFQETRGFSFADELIHIDKESYEVEKTREMKYSEKDKKDQEKLKALKASYWKDITKAFKNVGSIRKLPKAKVKKLSEAWLKQDEKYKVNHNFANVQCINCHDLHREHPFAIPPETSKQAKAQAMKERCLNCHVPDQSPEWYEKLEDGRAGRANEELVQEKISKLSCPKREP